MYRMGGITDYEDVIQDLAGIALEMYISLLQRGKEVFYSPIMQFAIKRYSEGRRFIGSNTTDVLSDQTKILGRSKIQHISVFDGEDGELDTWGFMRGRQPDFADAVQMKMDYTAWLQRLTSRDRKIAMDLSYGYTTGEVAKKYGVTAGLISQYRRRYEKNWNEFIADKNEPA
jgi:hypothetical protein